MTQVTEGSTDNAAAAVATVAQGGRPQRTGLAEVVEQHLTEIQRALPRNTMDPERFIRIVLTEFRKSPKLLLCTPTSFLGAMMQTAQLGLEPGGQLGHAFLIPYENSKLSREQGQPVFECQLQIGYKGYVELGGRRGILLKSREVRENDDFDFDLGSDEYLHHGWASLLKQGKSRGEVIGFWGKVVMPDGKTTFVVMDLEEINKRRDRSSAVQAAKRNAWMKTPWDTDYDAMARKTVIRAMVPQVALAPELQIALKADEAVIEQRAGDLNYTYRDAIDIGAPPAVDAGTGEILPTTVQEALHGVEDRATKDAALNALKVAFGPGYDDTDPAVIAWVQNWVASAQVVVDAPTTIQTPPDSAPEVAQDAAEGPGVGDGAPGPSEPPEELQEPPDAVFAEVLASTSRVIDTWPIETVKEKLREWGQSARSSNEKTLRLNLVTFLATERQRGNKAVEDLF